MTQDGPVIQAQTDDFWNTGNRRTEREFSGWDEDQCWLHQAVFRPLREIASFPGCFDHKGFGHPDFDMRARVTKVYRRRCLYPDSKCSHSRYSKTRLGLARHWSWGIRRLVQMIRKSRMMYNRILPNEICRSICRLPLKTILPGAPS